MKGLDNTSYSGTISLLPFTGLVLLGTGTVTEVDGEDPPIPENYITITGFRLNKYSIL
jgi:hypothetical protein